MNHIDEPELISVSPTINIRDDRLSQTLDFLCSPDTCEPDDKCVPNNSCGPEECGPRYE